MIGGVAAGLARHLAVDPVVIRLAFVALALVGGGGVLAYVIAWIVMPEDPEDGDAPRTTGTGAGTTTAAGILLIAAGGIILVQRLLPGFQWRYAGPAVLILLGVLVLSRRSVR